MTTKIAIISTENYENRSKIKDFIFKLKPKATEIIVSSGGRQYGGDKYIKKFSLEFGLQYQEYNPQYTVRNLYSVQMTYNYYGQKYLIYHDCMRNKKMIDDNDCIIIFNSEDEPWSKEFEEILKYSQKKQKKVVIIN